MKQYLRIKLPSEVMGPNGFTAGPALTFIHRDSWAVRLRWFLQSNGFDISRSWEEYMTTAGDSMVEQEI